MWVMRFLYPFLLYMKSNVDYVKNFSSTKHENSLSMNIDMIVKLGIPLEVPITALKKKILLKPHNTMVVSIVALYSVFCGNND